MLRKALGCTVQNKEKQSLHFMSQFESAIPSLLITKNGQEKAGEPKISIYSYK